MTSINKTDYEPSDDEEYMNSKQTLYFKTLLETKKKKITEEIKNKESELLRCENIADDAESASVEYSRSLAVSAVNRYKGIINTIDKAMERLEDGTYGYCIKTGQEIGIARLKFDPTVLYCIEAQEYIEKQGFDHIYGHDESEI